MSIKSALSVSLLAATLSFSATASEFDGVWNTEVNEEDKIFAQITVAPCEGESADLNGKRCGTFSGYVEDGATEEYIQGMTNLIGVQMLDKMQRKSATEWGKGTIWDPRTDREYRSKVRFLDEDTVKVSGCILGGLICLGEVWTREEAADAPTVEELSETAVNPK